ncbi:MAG: Uma2 family endonuclease [Chroococcidiopsidaceae cyanobacterium CP_BM_ER_R8_30]|nr:Uma2 family endonuclease [Chroococcidiopsidaceae cyanobacterium CP_BM_ER_R8_30]
MSQSVASESPILTDVAEDITFPPGDLWSDEPPLESDWHRKQMELLIGSLESWWQERQDFYVTGNLTIYYSPDQSKSEDFRGPDFFVVLGAERRERKSWVVWQENGTYPHVIVEILSDSTAAIDKGLKKQIYQDTFRTPDYFWFDPATLELKGFHLVDGQYQELTATEQGWLWSQQLRLHLGVYEGRLRFFTPDGQLVLLGEEQERQRAEQERQRAEQSERENARLREQLRALGIEPKSEL